MRAGWQDLQSRTTIRMPWYEMRHTPMAAREARIGPWLVAIGAALWGTESAWRIPLNGVFDEDVLVFWEHVILVALALPFIIPRLRELKTVRRATIAWLLLSGVAGSAVGTVLFT